MEVKGVMKFLVFLLIILFNIQILVYAEDCCVYETSVAGNHVHPWLDPPQSTWLAGKHSHTVTIQGVDYTTSESGEHYHISGTDSPSGAVPSSHTHTIVRNSVLYTTSGYEECIHHGGILVTICGDHTHTIEIPTESCLECPSNCQTCTCIESWSCTDWSNCVNGQQGRECTDANNCGTTNYKPVIAQSCCSESWTCTEWSSCVSNVQTRTCADSNNCGTTNDKPVESQSCTLCGNGAIDAGETCTNCPSDVSCGELHCLNGQCVECVQSSDCVGKERVTGEFVCSADNKGFHEKILETSGDCIDNKCTGSVEKLGPVNPCENFCQDGRCGCSEGYAVCEDLGKCVRMNALDVNDACACDFQCKLGYCRAGKCMQGLIANFKSADTVLKPGEETSVSFSISNPFDEEVFADVVIGIGSGSSISGVLGGEYCSGSQCKATIKLPGNGQGDITLQVRGNDIGTIDLQGIVTYTREGKESEISKELTVKVTETGKEETVEETIKQKEKTSGYQATSKLGKLYQSSKIFRTLIWMGSGLFIIICYYLFKKRE